MPTLRPYGEADLAALQELAVRAWTPVFASLREVLGEELFRRMHPDRRADQRRSIRTGSAPASPDSSWPGRSRSCDGPA